MQLELIQSPFQAHSNLLFKFAKLFLVDSNIYDTSDQALPYTDKPRKYKLRLTDCTSQVLIKHNTVEIINYNGTGTDGTYDFYIVPVLGINEIEVFDNTGLIEQCHLIITCYNIHIFTAFLAYKFKGIWNNLYQGLANRFIQQNIIQDLDGTYLEPSYNISKDYARLLGTTRYSKFTTAQYFTFLHALIDIHNNGGKYLAIYQIQEALTEYISKIDVLELEKYSPQHNKLYGKVYTDGTGISIYPSYIFQQSNEWGLLPYLSGYVLPNTNIGISDSTSDYAQWIITDGSLYTNTDNWGSLQVLGTGLTYIPGKEFNTTDVFTGLEIYTDGTDGTYTGFAGSKYVTLKNPVADATSMTVTTIGPVTVDDSFRYVQDYNLVDLGTMYSDGTISIAYKTFDNFNVLGKADIDGTSILDIQVSGHTDKTYLSYREDNFGSIVIVIKCKKFIDSELKTIIDDILKYIVPAHLKYYVIYNLTGIWDYAGQTDITLDEIENANATNVVWTPIVSGTVEDLLDMDFLVGDGAIVGTNGIVLTSSDSGENYSINNITSETLNSVYWRNYPIGVTGGTNGAIFKTVDGGTNWTDVSITVYDVGNITDVSYISSRVNKYGYYLATSSNGYFLKSSDRGSSWYPTAVGTNLTAVSFLDEYRGAVANIDGKVYTTTDGVNFSLLADTEYQINDIKYLDPFTILTIGVNYVKKIKTSQIDDSITVTECNIAIQDTFNKLFVYDLNKMYLVGENGTIMKTLDGGDSWSDIIVADLDDYNGIHMFSSIKMLVTKNGGEIEKIEMSDLFYESIKLETLL